MTFKFQALNSKHKTIFSGTRNIFKIDQIILEEYLFKMYGQFLKTAGFLKSCNIFLSL